jgi:DNA-binding NarL/FixJ family response regulator
MPGPAGKSIYVVDDDEGFRALACAVLESAGYRVREFDSGERVLEAAGSEPPSLVVLDVNLPGVNGYEVCRELRDAHAAAIAIVFVSGERTEAFDRSTGILIGGDDYLSKPVDPSEFVARVRRLVSPPGPAIGENGDGATVTDSLTPREGEILDLLAKGDSQDDIAALLVISPRTVATHIQHILEKLGVRSRAAAVAVALRGHRLQSPEHR